jgi:hypothetical protein
LGRRLGVTVRFTVAGLTSLRWDLHKLIETKNFRGVIDYIYERPSGHYLIEVKRSPKIARQAIWNVGRAANIYRA